MENPAAETLIHRKPDAYYSVQNRPFQGIPGIAVTPKGRLWAAWYAGGTDEGQENYVLLVTSTDRGNHWSEPVLAIDPPGNIRAFDPVLWMDDSNRLWVFWAQSYSTGARNQDDYMLFDGFGGVWAMHTRESEKADCTWSEPLRIANGVMMNKPVVLSDGTWALPSAVWLPFLAPLKETALKGEEFSNITISQDHGRTFFLQGYADIPDRGFDEHMIVEKRDGRLWMLVRTKYGIGQSFSEDMGKTWSPGEPAGLAGANSRFHISRLSSGRLLFVTNAPQGTALVGENTIKRSHLYAFLSDDDGMTWPHCLLLDGRDAVSYPDCAQDSDGTIYIVYDRDRYSEREILMARVREEEIIQGAVCYQSSALGIVVSRGV